MKKATLSPFILLSSLAFLAIMPTCVAAPQLPQSAPGLERSSFSQALFLKARQSVGGEMWKPGYGLSKGTLGCAAALCNVLKASGNRSVNSAMVTVARRQLLAAPNHCREVVIRNGEGKVISDAILVKNCQPGDILLAFMEPPTKLNGGPNAHCGIMGEGTKVFTNNWLNGIWTEVDVHQMFDYYPYVRLLQFSPVLSDRKDVKMGRLRGRR